MKTRKNADKGLRDLEARTLQGDLDAAWQLYMARRRVHGFREHDVSPFAPAASSGRRVVVETKHGKLVIQTVSETALYVTADHTNVAHGLIDGPWVVNRVPVFWTLHYFFNPAGYDAGWVPFNNDWGRGDYFHNKNFDAQREDHVARLRRLESPAHSTLHSYRADDYRATVSSSADRKILQWVTPVVQAWAASNQGAVGSGALIDVNNQIRDAEDQLQTLQAHVTEAQRRIAALIVDETRLDRGPKANPPTLRPCGSTPDEVDLHTVDRPGLRACLALDVHNVRLYTPSQWAAGRCPLLAGFQLEHVQGPMLQIARRGVSLEPVTWAQSHDLREMAQRLGMPLELCEDALIQEGLAWHAAQAKPRPNSRPTRRGRKSR